MTARYRKKPVVIEAMQFNNDAKSYRVLHWINENRPTIDSPFASWHNGALIIPTLEGDMTASKGDWIIKGVRGEFYPCKPDIFTATYEPVAEEVIP
jgi:hypothetical protein